MAQLSGVEARLTICGRGADAYEEKLHRLVEELKLSERVKFGGFVDGEEKTQTFLKADLCVVPSFTESFGMVVAEALAHGIPVIASRGTPWSRLEDKGCGLWVDNDHESLAKAIEQMSRMPLIEMGGRGREWMQQGFSWGKRATEVLALYEKLNDDSRARKKNRGYDHNRD